MCGDWSKIPSIFITALKDGELTVVMTTAKYPNGVVSGRIIAETKTKQGAYYFFLLTLLSPKGENPSATVFGYFSNLLIVKNLGLFTFLSYQIGYKCHLFVKVITSFKLWVKS